MKSLLKNRDGSALSFVIVALLVLIIMVGIVAAIAQTNIIQAGAQEKGLQAYYAARSGAEMAFAALWVTDTGSEATGTTLFKALKNGTKPSTETVDLGDAGTAEVSIDYQISGSEGNGNHCIDGKIQ